MVQKVLGHQVYEGHLVTQYSMVDHDKIMVTVPGQDERGPFRLDLVVAFFSYHLGEDAEMEAYVYGDEAMREVFEGEYQMKYERVGGKNFTFKPVFHVDIPEQVYCPRVVHGR
jgi:hypothetical protein